MSASLGLPQTLSYLIAFVLLLTIGFITKFSMGAVLMFILFLAHALVGAVGTDGWVQNITGNISLHPRVRSSSSDITIMFLLRFCAEFIEKRLGCRL